MWSAAIRSPPSWAALCWGQEGGGPLGSARARPPFSVYPLAAHGLPAAPPSVSCPVRHPLDEASALRGHIINVSPRARPPTPAFQGVRLGARVPASEPAHPATGACPSVPERKPTGRPFIRQRAGPRNPAPSCPAPTQPRAKHSKFELQALVQPLRPSPPHASNPVPASGFCPPLSHHSQPQLVLAARWVSATSWGLWPLPLAFLGWVCPSLPGRWQPVPLGSECQAKPRCDRVPGWGPPSPSPILSGWAAPELGRQAPWSNHSLLQGPGDLKTFPEPLLRLCRQASCSPDSCCLRSGAAPDQPAAAPGRARHLPQGVPSKEGREGRLGGPVQPLHVPPLGRPGPGGSVSSRAIRQTRARVRSAGRAWGPHPELGAQ